MTPPVLLVAPTAREAVARAGATLICGGGAEAGHAVESYLQHHPAGFVLVIGICGGLDPALGPGDLILARSVAAPGSPALHPNAALLETARRGLRAGGRRFVTSALLTLERPAGSAAEKTALWNDHGAGGVDLETYAIVAVVERHQLPWLALRAVLDGAGAGLPEPLRRWSKPADERALVRELARRPRDWPTMARLAWQMAHARRSLAQSVPSVVGAARSFVDLSLSSPSRRDDQA